MTGLEGVEEAEHVGAHPIVGQNHKCLVAVQRVIILGKVKVDMVEGAAAPEGNLGLKFGLEACHAHAA